MTCSGDLRQVGTPGEDDDEETEIILKPSERINGIRTWSSPKRGRLMRIEVTTTQGREFSAGREVAVKDVPSHHLLDKKVLKYLSGMRGVLRSGLTFHWEEETGADC